MIDFNKLPSDVFQKLVVNAIAGCVLLVLAWINQIMFTQLFENFAPLRIPIFLILFFAFIFIVVKIFFNLKDKYRPNFPEIKSDFFIKKRIFEHKIKDNDVIVHKRKYILVARRNELTSFKSKFQWTGGDHYKMYSGINRHKVKELERSGTFNTYEVVFSRTLNKDDVIEVEVIWELEDPNKSAFPFVSSTMYEPTDFLKFVIEFDNSKYQEVVCQEAVISGGNVLSSKIEKIPSNGRFEWELKSPKLLHNYAVKWL